MKMSAVESKIQQLVAEFNYDPKVLREFADFIQSQPKSRKARKKHIAKSKPLTMAELQSAVASAFNVKDAKELKKNNHFKLATMGRDLNLRTKDAWLVLYREWVAVPENEQHEEGPTCINGIDILKNFRPWHVFNLDPKNATSEDIETAFKKLAKQHHPDMGGDRRVFECLISMRDSLLAFR